MKKTYKIIFFVILMFVVVGIVNIVNAATATINAPDEADMGNITIKADVVAAQWNLRLFVNGSEIAKSSELDNYTGNLTSSFQGTYNAKTAESITVTLKGDVTDINKTTSEINKTKTIKIKEKVVVPEPKFSSVNQTVYARNETNVRESYTTSSKSLGMLQAGDEITRIGVGDNGWSKVTYNGKTAYIYSNNLVTTKPEDTKSTDKALKSLVIAEGTLDPEFSPDTTKYSISVTNNVEQATIEALANSDKAKVEITGNEKLVMGSNLVKITVTAEDGTTRIYNLEIVKTNQEPAQLTKLSIPGVKLSPEFKPDVYQYTIQLDANSTVTDFGIQTETNIKDATVEIIGNSNFKEGENIITIFVTSSDGKEKSSYQIIVNKGGANSGNDQDSKNKTANIILVILGLLVVVAITIVVVTIIKRKRAEADLVGDDDEVDPYRPSFKDEDLDSDVEARKEDFTGIYKHQIMSDDEMDTPQIIGNTERLETPEYFKEKTTSQEVKQDVQPQNEDYVPDTKPEKNLDNMEMTRRISTNYDYTLEQYKKSKNMGKGKHF